VVTARRRLSRAAFPRATYYRGQGYAPTSRAGDTTAVDPPPPRMIREPNIQEQPIAQTGGGVQIRGSDPNDFVERPDLTDFDPRLLGHR
jgi:hypothetical protein